MQKEIIESSNTYTVKRQDGGRDEMSRNANGAHISGIMPEYVIQTEGPETDANLIITRIDQNAPNQGVSGGNKGSKDLLQSKGLNDIKDDIMNAAWMPPPLISETMKIWEEDFDANCLKTKKKQESINQK